jgi:4-phospho-D-threonate 3-dehydrogenase / 4-phospho-D-erythronate 3-dehydrogenase
MDASRPPLALTLGDPAGIGPEIMAKALAEGSAYDALVPVVVGDHGVLAQVVEGAGLDLEIRRVDAPGDARGERGVVDLLDLDNMGEVRFGEIDAAHGRAALEWIERACALARDGAVEGIVTGPINKEAARAGGLKFPGHTELLADLLEADPDGVYTMFVVGKLRIFFLTRHLSLRDAIDALEEERVRGAIVHVDGLLRDLGVEDPKVALAALNPHAGEGGMMGDEEIRILRPAVERAREDGVDAVGPVPADAVFHQGHEGRFDGVIALYHDQGHIASKTLDFFGTVSATLGLPVIRTSVDHGTAYDLAGRFEADARGQVNALRVAGELVSLARRTASGSPSRS